MKHSIKKIFNNLNVYLLFILLTSLFSVLLTMEHTLSINKMDNLSNQKIILTQLTKLQIKDIDRALLQFNAQSNHLLNETRKLSNIYKYNYTQQFLLVNETEYRSDIAKLTRLTKEFNKKAYDYYIKQTEELSDLEKEELNKSSLKKPLHALRTHINSMIFKEISYNKTIFSIIEKFIFLSFFIILLLTFLYRQKLNRIYKDIRLLYSMGKNHKPADIFSEEIDAISLRINKKPTPNDNPSMIDKVTSIKNYKGLINSYADKTKGKKNKKDIVTTVTIFEIDNLAKNDKTYNKQAAQAILKKVAYAISLHETPVDIISRSAYNQFTLIFFRDTKELAYKNIETIKEVISEMQINIPGKGLTKITLSGGFMVKPPNMTLQESLNIAKKTLKHAKEGDGNKLSKEKDIK